MSDIILNKLISVMTATTFFAIITATGVLLSLFVNYFINKRTIKNELLKITSSTEQNYTTKILDERCKRYPDIYFVLSGLDRDLEAMEKGYVGLRNPLTKRRLVEINQKVETLDSTHAVFYSIKTAYAMAGLRTYLYQQVLSLKDDQDTIPTSITDSFRTIVSVAEFGLKTDLGIHIEEFQKLRQSYTGSDYKDFKTD